MTLHFIWSPVDFETGRMRLKLFEKLTQIGSLEPVMGTLYSDGGIHGETFRIVTADLNRPTPLVKCSIQKGGVFAGSLEWTLSGAGVLFLLKKKRGTSHFNILQVTPDRFQLVERDQQKIVEIYTGSNEALIWDADVISNQRSKRNIHELTMYAAILIRQAFPQLPLQPSTAF